MLEDLLAGLTKSKPGKQAIVAVESFDESFRWVGTAGKTAAGTAVAEDTPFFIASIDKLYNATLAMMLVESGKLGIGMMRFRIPRLSTPLGSIPAVLGHTGSTGCWLFYCPELDVLISGTVEDAAAGPVPFKVVPRILEIISKTGW